MVVGKIWEQLAHGSAVSCRKNEKALKPTMVVQLYKHSKACGLYTLHGWLVQSWVTSRWRFYSVEDSSEVSSLPLKYKTERPNFPSQVFCLYRTSLYFILTFISLGQHSHVTSRPPPPGFICSLQMGAPSSIAPSPFMTALCGLSLYLSICVGLRASQGQGACLAVLASYTAPGLAYLMSTQ